MPDWMRGATADVSVRLRTKNGVGDKIANPAKELVELRGIEPLTLRPPVVRKRKK